MDILFTIIYDYLRLFTIIYDYLFRLFTIIYDYLRLFISIISNISLPTLLLFLHHSSCCCSIVAKANMCFSMCTNITACTQKVLELRVRIQKPYVHSHHTHDRGPIDWSIARTSILHPGKAPHKICAKISYVMKHA